MSESILIGMRPQILMLNKYTFFESSGSNFFQKCQILLNILGRFYTAP